MTPRIGDVVAIRADREKDFNFLLGSITQIKQDWETLFTIKWDDGRIWQVKEELALEFRQNFLDNL